MNDNCLQEAKQTLSDVVYQGIHGRILNSVYPVGYRIPTEQELCAEYSVGRSSVREAIRTLQAHGFLESTRGRGTYVISQYGNQANSLSKWVVDNKESISDYMKVRLAVESLSVKLLISGYTDEKLARLTSIEERFERAIHCVNVPDIIHLDEALHATIAELTDNRLLIEINQKLIEAFVKYRTVTFECDDGYAGAINEHNNLLKAIKCRDTDEALYRLRVHLENSYNITLQSAQLAPLINTKFTQ
ncbi:MAG: FCD domain-containing protein [Clostridia bacterium]|nr:FCD domain-containing protein [Clostridia bacterium]